MTAHSLLHTEGTDGCAKQSTGAQSGVVFKRARLQHPGLRKALRIRIPEPGELQNGAIFAADCAAADEKIMWESAESVSMDAADYLVEAGRWEMQQFDAAWSTPSTLPCASEPDSEADRDAELELEPAPPEAIEWAGSETAKALEFLVSEPMAVGSKELARAGDGLGGQEVHEWCEALSVVDPQQSAREEGLCALEHEQDLRLCFHRLEGAAGDMDAQPTGLVEEFGVLFGEAVAWEEEAAAQDSSPQKPLGALTPLLAPLCVEGGAGGGFFVESPLPGTLDPTSL